MEPPDCIDPRIWEKSATQNDWHLMDYGYERRIVACWEYTICCQISNMHIFDNMEQYETYLWQDRATVEWLISKRGLQRTTEHMPHMYDRKNNLNFKVKVVMDLEEVSPGGGVDWCMAFDLRGETHQETYQYLLGSQLQDIKSYMSSCYEWTIKTGSTERILESMSSDPKVRFVVPANVKGLLTSDTDWDIIPNTTPGKGIAEIVGEKWSQMKVLPRLKYEDPPNKAPWKALLIAADSSYIETKNGTDQEILGFFKESIISVSTLRSSKSAPPYLYNCIKASVDAAIEGHMVRDRIVEDTKAFGIDFKRKIRNAAEATATGEWKRSEFPLEKQGLPSWVEDELDLLYRECRGRWVELEKNAQYTPIDEVAEDLVDKFIGLVDTLKVSSVIEKWQVGCTRIFSQLHTDRNRISLCPIITRCKEEDIGQIWGLVLLGPHHVKRDTDNAPLLLFEFVENCEEEKYPKHTVLSLNMKKLDGEIYTKLAAIKVTSCSRNKLFTFSTIRRVLIQPASVFSQILLQRAADNNELNLDSNPEVSLYIGGALRGMTAFQWVRKVLCLEFLMAIYNNAQLEGFLANIRRLHMSRHAMIERHQVFIPFGSDPASKVEECIINNPIVLYLAKTWNDMPNVHY
ncbi:PA polymerase subunit [Upolu virus]|uniref:PA polymerase subunit n=1 Tax=Upolu virus TaxID=1428581 RepID=X2CXC2_9ORTO|nr:PA polymerase subunit [Upolu virus]AHB34056.1 PA polymerase subunit [Upolu virus]